MNDSARHVCCKLLSVALNAEEPLTSLTSSIIGAAITVHRELGPGLMESADQACLEYELAQLHLPFESQVHVPIVYRDVCIDRGYRIDLLVERSVIVEVKSVEVLAPIHAAQLITYLKFGAVSGGAAAEFQRSCNAPWHPAIHEPLGRHVTPSMANVAAPRCEYPP